MGPRRRRDEARRPAFTRCAATGSRGEERAQPARRRPDDPHRDPLPGHRAGCGEAGAPRRATVDRVSRRAVPGRRHARPGGWRA